MGVVLEVGDQVADLLGQFLVQCTALDRREQGGEIADVIGVRRAG